MCERNPVRVQASGREVTARGTVRARWYRLVYRDGEWDYFAGEAAPRERGSVESWCRYGEVYPGELVAQHRHGRPNDAVYEVTDEGLVPIRFERLGEHMRVYQSGEEPFLVPNPRPSWSRQ